jgi:hypothetical protein
MPSLAAVRSCQQTGSPASAETGWAAPGDAAAASGRDRIDFGGQAPACAAAMGAGGRLRVVQAPCCGGTLCARVRRAEPPARFELRGGLMGRWRGVLGPACRCFFFLDGTRVVGRVWPRQRPNSRRGVDCIAALPIAASPPTPCLLASCHRHRRDSPAALAPPPLRRGAHSTVHRAQHVTARARSGGPARRRHTGARRGPSPRPAQQP